MVSHPWHGPRSRPQEAVPFRAVQAGGLNRLAGPLSGLGPPFHRPGLGREAAEEPVPGPSTGGGVRRCPVSFNLWVCAGHDTPASPFFSGSSAPPLGSLVEVQFTPHRARRRSQRSVGAFRRPPIPVRAQILGGPPPEPTARRNGGGAPAAGARPPPQRRPLGAGAGAKQ